MGASTEEKAAWQLMLAALFSREAIFWADAACRYASEIGSPVGRRLFILAISWRISEHSAVRSSAVTGIGRISS